MVLSAIPALNGISEKIGVGLTMSRNWTDPPMQIMLALAVGLIVLIVGEYVLATQLGIWYMALPFLPVYAYYHTFMMATPAANTEEFLTFKVRVVALLPSELPWAKLNLACMCLPTELQPVSHCTECCTKEEVGEE